MLRNVVLVLRKPFEHRVISLTTREPIGKELENAGVDVMASGSKSPWRLPQLRRRARKWVSSWRPDVVHCWMYHANIFGRSLLGAAPASSKPAYVASVRGALNSPRAQRLMLRLVRWIDARTSRAADAILFNSSVSAAQHQAIGYGRERSLVIPNGFDTDRFAPDVATRKRMRAELGAGDSVLIGMVARFEPVKGHELLLQAVSILKDLTPDFLLVLAGRGCEPGNQALMRLISNFGIAASVRLLGERRDIPALLNACDMVVCPSLSESFPNAVGEAMSSGLPCVVSDVGDCALLVGDTGRIALPNNPAMLAARLAELIEMGGEGRRSLGESARSRIVEQFSMAAALDRYAGLYESVTLPKRKNS